jgi:hypothetical protein
MTTNPGPAALLDEQIEQWRSYLRRRQATHSGDVTELEDHLRIETLFPAGREAGEALALVMRVEGSEGDAPSASHGG